MLRMFKSFCSRFNPRVVKPVDIYGKQQVEITQILARRELKVSRGAVIFCEIFQDTRVNASIEFKIPEPLANALSKLSIYISCA
jgi:hypothetical protein